MEKKEIDVIILTYNRKGLLLKTLERLKTQTIQDFNLILTDDGSTELINPNEYPFIKKYIWDSDEGYHRVRKFNESIKMCVSDKILILDDDCEPSYDTFLETHINNLNHFDISRGIVVFPDKTTAQAWLSTANMGFKKTVIDELKGFDPEFDGHYGYEDSDLGVTIERRGFSLSPFDQGTSANHLGIMYKNGDRSDEVIGHNKNYFIQKWGFPPK
mgnify:CR=1 FL=1|jgi:glycosyltransferase involved in cell wall biosynthesis